VNEHETGDTAWSETTSPPIEWRSGRWQLELRGDELAEITFDGRLALRSIRGVARDRDWGTISSSVTTVTADSQRLAVNVALIARDAALTAHLVVEAQGDQLDIHWECHANAAFLRNRLGLVVLHPAETAGAALRITHPNGATESTSLPRRISPHQPVSEIQALEWEHGGLTTNLEFWGDVFEMEDQRNWTDASYKTYSTPLALPFPVQMHAGETVAQSIRVRCSATGVAPAVPVGDRIELVASERRVPSIGTSASTGPTIAGPARTGDFLLVELPAHTEAWRAVLDRAVLEAAGIPLDVRIIAADEERLEEVLDAIAPLNVVRVGAFTPDSHISEPALWNALLSGLASRGLTCEPVGGTRAHFTELNRALGRLPASVPAYAFSITPQMHATGRDQIVESIAIQRLVAENAVRSTGAPVHVGPVTLRPRFNAVATTGTPDADVVDLANGYGAAVTPEATDSRQRSHAMLAWTIASAAALAVDGVESISWFEASGPRGLRDNDSMFDVATALDWLGEISGARLLEPAVAPAGLWTIGAQFETFSVVFVANLRAQPAAVSVTTSHGEERLNLRPFTAQRVQHG
jgi:hypothetical protein